MRRTTSLLGFVGVFLLVSLLWPFEDRETTSEFRPIRYFEVEAPPLPPGLVSLSLPNEWGNTTERTLFNGTRQMLPSTVSTVPVSTPSRWNFAPDPGMRVLPGTDRLLIEYSVGDVQGRPMRADFSFTAASDSSAGFAMEGLGRAMTKIQPQDADYAPDPNSRWRFSVYSLNSVPINVQIRVVAVRADQVPETFDVVFSEVWRDRPTFPAYNRETTPLLDAGPRPEAGPSAFSPPAGIPLRRLPPLEVETVRVTFTYNSSTPPELHYRPLLSWHGADRSEWEAANAPPTRAVRQSVYGTFEWDLEVEPRMWESPFGRTTRWAIRINWHGDSPESPVLMEGSYRMRVEAVRAIPD